jgi:hypothetical protein
MVALGKGRQNTDPPHPLRLLRACHKRPCRRGKDAQGREENKA